MVSFFCNTVYMWVSKTCSFQPVSLYLGEAVQDRDIVAFNIEGKQEIVCNLSISDNADDLE